MPYKNWVTDSERSAEELAAMERQAIVFDYLPLVSLVLVASEADEVWIKGSMDSILSQVYPHLELCVCSNGSERPHVREALEEYASSEERIKAQHLPEKKSWTEAYNEALSMATGEFVALLDEGDELAPEALFRVVEFLQHGRTDVVYTDEDSVDAGGERLEPIFKPYWSPDLLLSTAYTGRLCMMRRSLLDSPETFEKGLGGAEEHDLILRVSEKTELIHHMPEVLYHRRKLPGQLASGVGRSEASPRAVDEALLRREVNAAAEPGLGEGSLRVVRRVTGRPKVSAIVVTPEDATEASIVEGLEKTSYPVDQVILAGGGRNIYPDLEHVGHPFPARALNLAAAQAGGDYLLFVDHRAQITDSGWLTELLCQAQRREVGAVGGKLLNPDGSLRHGGSLLDLSQLAGHTNEPASEDGIHLPIVDRMFNFGAASAACMMVRRGLFERVEGFDEENLPMAFYDLDLCFRLRERGRLNVYTPYAPLMVRGSHETTPGEEEIAYMWSRWWEKLAMHLHYQRSPLSPGYQKLEDEVLAAISF